MKERVDRFLAWGGVCVALGGYVSSLLGILDDPFFAFAALVAGVGLAGWNWYATESDVEEEVNLGRVERRPRRSQTDRKLARNLFWAAVGLFGIALIVDGFSFLHLADIRGVVQLGNEVPLVSPESGEPAGSSADKLPSALCRQLKNNFDLPAVAQFSTEGVCLTVTKRKRISWVQIEDVSVVVEKYSPEPPLPLAPAPAAIRPPLIFLANINREVKEGKRTFPARQIAPPESAGPPLPSDNAFPVPDVFQSYSVVLLDDDRPSRLIVKVNAESGGVYTYRIHVRLRYLWQTQLWTSEPRTVRFVETQGGSLGPIPQAPIAPVEAPAPPPP